ncbi:MAG: PDZ domain-containing protein [Acidobacteriota bacterium]
MRARSWWHALISGSWLAALAASQLLAVNVKDTRLLSQPAISKSHIAFVYAGDIWVCNLDGSGARALTTHEGPESNPHFSPGGALIAFSGSYDGNTDVYVVPVDGGVPKRLTWHPGNDTVQGFTPDGKAVLFSSPRAVYSARYTQLYTVDLNGNFPEQLKIPHAVRGSYSPDGAQLAYNPLYDAFTQWKHYRGGTVSTVSIFRFSDYSVHNIPQPAGRCNDVQPRWMGDTIYFRSDRNGEFNLFSYDVKTKAVKQLTGYTDFPVLDLAAGDNRLIYEQAGYLHLYDPGSGKSRRLTIAVPADLLEVRPRYVKGFRYIRGGSLSPSGARAALEFRGEIVTVPAEKGDFRNLTQTPGVHERSPAWSPDGRSVAYFSEESGEYELHIRNQDGKGEVRKLKLSGAGFYESLLWSPDSRKLSFADNSWSLYWLDVDKGTVKKIASEYLYGPGRARNVYSAWSPDSNWIAYTLGGKSYIQTVYVYSLEQDKSFQITDGLSDATEPVFDEGGKYFYFFASTDAGPGRQWFDMSNADVRVTRSIYLAVLQKDIPSPLAKESDEEKGSEADKKPEKPAEKTDEKASGDKPKDAVLRIDLEGIQFRIVALPLPAGEYASLQAGAEGQIYYLESLPVVQPLQGQQGPPPARYSLHKYDLKKRKDDTIIGRLNGYSLSLNNKRIMYSTPDALFITDLAEKIEPGKGKVNTDSVEVRIDPRSEWNQMFEEVWRINRDYFYDPNMHGADWPAMRERYRVFLPDVACRNDLNRVLTWMCSELAVGHHRVGGGDFLYQPKAVPGGLLGADYSIENGRYRFKKAYGGLNWNPELQSPLTAPGVSVVAGEYLLAVQGRDLRPPANIYSFFENTAGKLIEITVGPNPDGSGSRTVSVVPIANEYGLRNRDWVEGNLHKVEEATGGRVAYVYVPNTSTMGHTYFKRYFFPQAYKEAIIIDERFNGGGQVADYYIDWLRKPFISYWAMRYGADLKTPSASIQGPKVMLIDETAGSGGDLLPWMFRKFQLGKLIGKRTWGGLVGILGFPVLMDGGMVTAPNLAIWTEDGWVVENEGVPPDIEVEQTPADVIQGRDPQLERAIQEVMDQLKKNPHAQPKRPPYPVRVKPAPAKRVS